MSKQLEALLKKFTPQARDAGISDQELTRFLKELLASEMLSAI